jgi:16S rRNA (guanine527-N7)-methyltransferase
MPQEILTRGLKALGISYEQSQIEAFLAYLSELKKWNRAYSLTSIRDDREVIIKHFLDSLLYLKALPEDTRSIADVGAGAGFPGLPIRIIRPALELHLIEPVRKKAAFLRNMVRRLGLAKVTVHNMRVEEVHIQVDAALTRALFTVKEFHEQASHIVRPGGVLILSKGPRAGEELRESSLEHTLLEAELPFTETVRLLISVFS